MTSRPTPVIPDDAMRETARAIYGQDPAGYEAGRPDYPERVFDVLRDRCDLAEGTSVLEVGPGTGRVTRRLLAAGVNVTAVEPDVSLARHLRETLDPGSLTVIASGFESAELGDRRFDLVVAAMAWHWVDQAIGLPKLARVLRPGGWAALWWTMFSDPERPDAYRDATRHLLPAPPAQVASDRPPFELDVDGWRTALGAQAGMVDIEAEVVRWTARLETAQLRALQASMISVRRRPPDERAALLDELSAIAERDFRGVVEQPMLTALYSGRRPTSGTAARG